MELSVAEGGGEETEILITVTTTTTTSHCLLDLLIPSMAAWHCGIEQREEEEEEEEEMRPQRLQYYVAVKQASNLEGYG